MFVSILMSNTHRPAGPTIRIPAPEPDLTPAELRARAAALRPRVLEEAEAAAARGGFSTGLFEAFTEAGFYRVLQPRMFGGYEMGFDTFLEVIVEIGRGDAGTAWNLALGAGHALQLATYFSEEAQADAFGPDGHFVCPQRALPVGKATVVEGGYRLSGRWDYASGSTHGNWFMGAAAVQGEDAPRAIAFVVPRSECEVLDDWGGDRTLGLQASGSNTVLLHDVFVPGHRTDRFDWVFRPLEAEGTPGWRLHGNPLYLGRPLTNIICELAAPIVGAAKGALDEYDELMRARTTSFPPTMPRTESSHYQQWLGEAMGLVDSAEALLLAAARGHMALGRAWAEQGAAFGIAEDTRMRQLAMTAGRLAVQAIELMFSTAGTRGALRGSRLQRCYRDAGMYRTHVSAQWDVLHHSAGLAAMDLPILI